MSEGLCSGCSTVVIIIKSSVIIYIKVNLERVTFFLLVFYNYIKIVL